MTHVPMNPHASYPPTQATIRRADSQPENLVDAYVYGLTDPSGAWRYVGSCTDKRRRWSAHSCPPATHSSLLIRYMRETGGSSGWTMHELQKVTYDKFLCPEALRVAEDGFMRRLRDDGHELLNNNRAYLNTRHAAQQKTWRDARPNYMSDYCRAWRAQRRAQLEQQAQANGS